MAWVRQKFSERASRLIATALDQVDREQEQIEAALGTMSRDEWQDFVADIEKMLEKEDKRSMSAAGDGWIDIEWRRLRNLRNALGMDDKKPPFEGTHPMSEEDKDIRLRCDDCGDYLSPDLLKEFEDGSLYCSFCVGKWEGRKRNKDEAKADAASGGLFYCPYIPITKKV